MSILLKPRMSEKTYAQSQDGVFVFDVGLEVNKHQVASAVAAEYDVTVEKVNITIVKGKEKRAYKKRKYETGRRNDIKKAYVTLKEGDSIPIFAAVEEAEQKQEEADTKASKKAAKKAKKEKKGKD